MAERWLASGVLSDIGRSFVEANIWTVKRALGIKPTPETVREQTRERVRKHRAKLARKTATR
jgi:hypothetical protein